MINFLCSPELLFCAKQDKYLADICLATSKLKFLSHNEQHIISTVCVWGGGGQMCDHRYVINPGENTRARTN